MAREKFEEQVLDLEGRLSSMADLAKQMLHGGVQALDDLDRERCEEVAKLPDRLADMDEEIERGILRMLALENPMAGDLRRLAAALKLITYINRIGRYGYDIARVVREWPEGRQHVARMVSLRDMATKVEAMLDEVIAAFNTGRAPNTHLLLRLEDDVDAQRHSVWRECITLMAQSGSNIEPCAHYMMVARYLERCGDNVCKMAEKIQYAATGERLLLK